MNTFSGSGSRPILAWCKKLLGFWGGGLPLKKLRRTFKSETNNGGSKEEMSTS